VIGVPKRLAYGMFYTNIGGNIGQQMVLPLVDEINQINFIIR
jgi:hypothetical protein